MSAVTNMYREHQDLVAFFGDDNPSFQASLERTLPKVLLLAAASEFEVAVCQHIRNYATESSTDKKLAIMIDRWVLTRQYHRLFDWDSKHAGPLWAAFGEDFKRYMKSRLKEDGNLKDSLDAFLEIGRLRNELVHQDYANYVLLKTSSEIFKMYETATRFVDSLPQILATQMDESPE
ncbi:HEPN domain-containing protein [Streptomyces europaeiscabiei]|uniref:HEPN domain-containing protein n=1 Tax=Streptomyces TaxID=1883 RepID=UPI002DD942E6|nr:HEPN domain-containing protein [Streptomyces sp. NBC_00481]WRY95739.1 HEPN domain-containing protein [Streptomyces sp. NBC_00481]